MTIKKTLSIDFYWLSILSIDHHEQLNPNIPLQSIENEAKKTSDRTQCSSDPARFAFRLLSWITLKWNLKCIESITIKGCLFVCLYCLRQYMTNTTIAQLGQRGTIAGNLIGHGWETTVHWAVTYHVSTSCTHCTYLVRGRSYLRDSIQSSLRGRVKMISLKLMSYSSTFHSRANRSIT